jgi:colicin import membrane protein
MSLHSQALFLALLASLSLPAFAQTASPGDAERDRSELERAATLRQQSGEERDRIDADRVRGEAECRTRILENRCRESLKQSLITRENAVRAQQNEAGRLEREVKARAVAAREAAREADRPVREAEQAEQARLFREKQALQSGHAIGPSSMRGPDGQKVGRSETKAGQRERNAAAAAERARRAREDAARYDEKQKKHDERAREAAAKAAAQTAASNPGH